MKSLKELFKIGNGPSSSHTIGPRYACLYFLNQGQFDFIEVTLYGSLALTGKGHQTDKIIKETLSPIKNKVIFDFETQTKHPNTMLFKGYKNKKLVKKITTLSIGGGDIKPLTKSYKQSEHIYKLTTFSSIRNYCLKENKRIYEYVDEIEENIDEYLKIVLDTMLDSIKRGLNKDGYLPGKLKVMRKAKIIYEKIENDDKSPRKKLLAYAYAASEESSSGERIVIAPTCGSCGVLPSVIKYSIDKGIFSSQQILNALKTSGIIGNLVKQNASISGAVAGCQAEIGVACAMSAAFLAELNGYDIDTIQRASEIALEHHLGLTCDPIGGYVQIPCIERNGIAALSALDSYHLAVYLEGSESKIDFDSICKTMLKTGIDISSKYKETSKAGLAKLEKSLK